MTGNDGEGDETAKMLSALSEVTRLSTLQKRHFVTYLIKLAMVEMIDPLSRKDRAYVEERSNVLN